MSSPVGPRALDLVGRVAELGLLRETLAGAAAGTPAAVLVRGEAGVGKTALVLHACDEAQSDGFEVLLGRCVRFSAASAPYLPFTLALERWLGAADARLREELLAECPELISLVPSLPNGTVAPPRPLPLLDAVISRIAARRPLVLVVDDLQWADASSLDALSYLVAGLSGRSMALFATIRDEGLEPGHPLHGWSADVRRMPAVRELHLDRLTEEETREQVALLGGTSTAFGTSVHARSGGNPYLTELLVRGSDGLSQEGEAIPELLRNALLSAWHRLSSSARTTTRLLAVAGRPLRAQEIDALVSVAGGSRDQLYEDLREATDKGVLAGPDAQLFWFRHPLLADVLYDTLMPGQATPLHAACARIFEANLPAADEVSLAEITDLAAHHTRAGQTDRTFELSLRAADMARDLAAGPEEAHHLTVAADLWQHVDEGVRASVGTEVDLLDRASTAVRRSGDAQAAYEMLARALDAVDREADPLRAADLLLRLSDAGVDAAIELWPSAADMCAEALALTVAHPESVEHVAALSMLSISEAWKGDRAGAARHAARAVEAAPRAGADVATAVALAARAFSSPDLEADPRVWRDAREAYRLATSGPDLLTQTVDMVWFNTLLANGKLGMAIDLVRERFVRAASCGDRAAVAMLSALAASLLLSTGQFAEAGRFVREGLGTSPRGLSLAMVRLGAVQLTTRTGRLDEASEHLRRVEEVFGEPEVSGMVEAATVLAEYLLARGEPGRALTVVRRSLPGVEPVDPHYADQVLLWGTRATGDLRANAVDRRDDAGMAQAVEEERSLADLSRSLRPADLAARHRNSNPVTTAVEALLAAERARVRGDPVETLWAQAAKACAVASMGWEQACSLRRLGEARARRGGPRASVAAPLRQAHVLATEMGAVPLRLEVEALARFARVSLAEVPAPGPHRAEDPLEVLTAREREVLAHLVAGRTYREIAGALFISEKTVSVHVSNLLRKTATSSRVEVAALARRHGIG